jgi:hypothetical protein
METKNLEKEVEELRNPCIDCKDRKWYCSIIGCNDYGDYMDRLEYIYNLKQKSEHAQSQPSCTGKESREYQAIVDEANPELKLRLNNARKKPQNP